MDFMNAFFKFSQKQFRVLSSYKNNPVKLLSFLLFIQFFAVCDSGRNSEKKEILLRLISEFQIDLQKNLESAIRTKGIVGAINVCRTISPKKEADLKAEFPGVLIRRVSEKPRNPSHRPEIWETEIFNQWKESQKTGMGPLHDRFIQRQRSSNFTTHHSSECDLFTMPRWSSRYKPGGIQKNCRTVS